MSGALIAQLIIALGPVALTLIPKLAEIWNKTLTVEEVNAFCDLSLKSYEQYILEAKAKLTGTIGG